MDRRSTARSRRPRWLVHVRPIRSDAGVPWRGPPAITGSTSWPPTSCIRSPSRSLIDPAPFLRPDDWPPATEANLIGARTERPVGRACRSVRDGRWTWCRRGDPTGRVDVQRGGLANRHRGIRRARPRPSVATAYLPRATGLGVMLTNHAVVRPGDPPPYHTGHPLLCESDDGRDLGDAGPDAVDRIRTARRWCLAAGRLCHHRGLDGPDRAARGDVARGVASRTRRDAVLAH